VGRIDREAKLRAARELREQGDLETADLLETEASAVRLWERVVESLQPRVTPADLDTYLLAAQGVGLSDTLLTVSVPSEDAKEWILHHFGDDLRPLIADLSLPNVNVRFLVVPVVTTVPGEEGMPALPAIRVSRRLDRWRAELLDLSKANRLLHARPGTSMLELAFPETTKLFDDFTGRPRPFTVYRADPPANPPEGALPELRVSGIGIDYVYRLPDDETIAFPARAPKATEVVIPGNPRKVTAALYRMRLKARSALQEQGTGVLYIAFGTLRWTDGPPGGSRIVTPLILVPTLLEQETALSPYHLAALEDEPILNPAIVRKLDADYGIQLRVPEPDGGDDVDLPTMLDAVREAVSSRPDWEVVTDAHVGLFSFAKHALYVDLARNHTRFARHPVLRAISGEIVGVPSQPGHLPSAEELDIHQHPREVFQVLDADASQREAIAAVQAGANLVIQGPPGTGKSQTITNIIAETLAAGKTVLFVSEKMAALRVVAKRLEEAGLSEFCLEAHSQDLQKKRIIQSLEAVLRSDDHGGEDSDHLLAGLDRLREVRGALNAYVAALHDDANPLAMSAYQVHGEIAARSVPVVPFTLADIASLTPGRLGRLQTVVRHLVAVAPILLAEREHPWYGCTITSYLPQEQAILTDQFERLAHHGEALDTAQAVLRRDLAVPRDETMPDARWLADYLTILRRQVTIPRHWLEIEDPGPVTAQAEDERRTQTGYRRRRSGLLERYEPDVFDLNLAVLDDGFSPSRHAAWERVRGDGDAASRADVGRPFIEPAVAETLDAFHELRRTSDAVLAVLGLPRPETVSEITALAEASRLIATAPRPTAQWFEPGSLLDLEQLCSEAETHQTTVQTVSPTLATRFEDTLYEIATPALRDRLETEFGSWTHVFKPAYRGIVKRVRRTLRAPGPLTHTDLVDAVTSACQVSAARQWYDEQRDRLVRGFGLHYAGLESDWTAVTAAMETVHRVVMLLGGTTVPAQVQRVLLGEAGGPALVAPRATALSNALTRATSALTHLDELLDVRGVADTALPLQDTALDQIETSLRTWTAAIQPLWTAAATMRAHLRPRSPDGVASLAADVAEARLVRGIEAALAGRTDQVRVQFGALFEGIETDWDDVLARLTWTRELRAHIGGPLAPDTVERLQRPVDWEDANITNFVREFTAMDTWCAKLRTVFAPGSFPPDAAVSLGAVASWAIAKRDALPRLEEWCDRAAAIREADEAGLTEFVTSLLERRPVPAIWPDAFLAQVYTQWLTWRYNTAPALAAFRREHHADLIQEFRRLDRQQWRDASRRIARRLRRSRPHVSATPPRKSEAGILLHEATKRTRFRPLRRLFAEMPNLLLGLKPCLLMSPLAVAQHLGESPIDFDVVIFDEASQILPADAVGAIGRGRQVIVVGDRQQLPPTRFFSVGPQYDDEEEDEELPESILDVFDAIGVTNKRLLWHYRSRHEQLIAFSNRHFYEQALVTFPSVDAERRAIDFRHVATGVYDRGNTKTNLVEAHRLVDLVVDHVRAHPHVSVGVITFSEPQMEVVQSEIDERKRQDPALEVLLREEGPDGFFVKNLENVQGDERDVIFFSVGYGPDADGKMLLNFGPLNKQGGERRLNVAITRARQHVTILASFLPQAIDRTRTSAKGVHLLREYLEYAERGDHARPAVLQDRETDSQFEEVVATRLRDAEVVVVPRVGMGVYRVDLGIRVHDEGGFVLGLECDGPTYMNAKTARDRDRLRHDMLTALGWRADRLWSAEWVKDREGAAQRVLALVGAAREQTGDMAMREDEDVDEEEDASDDEIGEDDVSTAGEDVLTDLDPLHVAAPYRRVDFGPQRYTQESLARMRGAALAEYVLQCVTVEGPVHLDRVARAICQVFSFEAATKKPTREVMRGVSAAVASGGVGRRGDLLWSVGMTTPAIRALDEEGHARSITEVAPEEIEEAVLAVLRAAYAMPPDALVIEVARAIGYARTGSQVATAIRSAIDAVIQDGRATLVSGQVRVA
jgi:very-short-patch-repair endonuclease